MGRIAPVMLVLALVACASAPPPATPRPAPVAAPIASAPPSPRKAPTVTAARGSYAQEVDDLFRALDAEGGQPARAQTRAPGQPARQVIDTIAPVSPGIAATLDAVDQQEDYEANLAACLDGELPAFCDRAKLSPADAARVQRAEFEANLIACIDPERQHLCRPELLPEVVELPARTPIDQPAPARVAARSTSGASPRRAMGTAAPPARVSVPAPAAVVAAPSSASVQPQATARPPGAQPRQAARFASVQAAGLSAAAITERMIRASIAAYPGRCPCPYNRDRAGRQCGGRSAYWRIGGYSPLCYPRDVTPEMIEEFRARGTG